MNIYAIINGINSICALAIAIIIFFNKSKKPIQLTYALFSLLLSGWTFLYFIWGFRSNSPDSQIWMILVQLPICFIHMAFFHFTLILTGELKKYKAALIFGYFLSLFLAYLNQNGLLNDFDNIRQIGPFLYWPHASKWLALLISAQVFYVTVGFIVNHIAVRHASQPSLKERLKSHLIVGIIGWSGGLTNWFGYYNTVGVLPIGNIGITFYLVSTFYLIFKHDLLDINLAIKRTFIYTLLTLVISLIYTLFILISEKLFQAYIGYDSPLSTILAAAVITLLFNPLKDLISKSLDKILFGKNISDLSVENDQMRSELQRQDRMKAVSTLAAGMAHEIKNPLTTIRTFADYLPSKYDDPQFRLKFQRMVVDEVDRVNNIVKQLLEFARPSLLELKVINLKTVLEETLLLISNNLLENKISLQKNISEFTLYADRNQLKQVFLNILINAIQAMPNGGALIVQTTQSEGGITIEITDTGVGISKALLGRVYEPFVTNKENGTGLGLSIVHGIIEKHGGKIHINSTVGKGTTVSVFLKNQS